MNIRRSVLAVAAHPDDIEFVMAGTLLQLRDRGWEVHYFNIANGCCGSTTLDRQQCAAVRLEEARRAAAMIPAEFYPPICNDLEIFYNQTLHRQVAAVVRKARPSIVLTHALSDYMEDHQNAARLAIGGAFTRGMSNFESIPIQPIYGEEVAVYHAQPHGNRDPLGEIVQPSHYVDVTPVLDRKRQMLAAHVSQDQWLGATQGISAYLETMVQFNKEVGQFSQLSSSGFQFAEGWRKHFHLGLSPENFDPLSEALSDCCLRQG